MWSGRGPRTSVDSQVSTAKDNLPSRPHTSCAGPYLSTGVTSSETCSGFEAVGALSSVRLGPTTASARRGAMQRQTSTPAAPARAESTHGSYWPHIDDESWQCSLPRHLESSSHKVHTPAHELAYYGIQHRQTPAGRSSSAVPFTGQSTGDVEFHATQPTSLRRPVAHKPSKSLDTKSSLTPRVKHGTVNNSVRASPNPSLKSRFGNLFRRRAKSVTSNSSDSSCEQSPVAGQRWQSPSNDSRCSKDSKASTDSKDGKAKSARKKLPFRNKSEEMEMQKKRRVSDIDNMSVISSASVSAAGNQHERVLKRDSVSVPSTPTQPSVPLSRHKVDRQICRQDALSCDSPVATPTKSQPAFTSSTSSVSQRSVEGDEDTAHSGPVDEARSRAGAARLKLPSTPPADTSSSQLPNSSTKSPPSRPAQLKIHLNDAEQAIVAKRYLGSSAVSQAVADVHQLMTSSCHVTTPVSGSEVTSASDNDLVSRSGSKTPSVTSSADSINEDSGLCGGTDVGGGGVRRLVEGSFRRAELMPTVRRFIATCQQLSAAATDAHKAAEFESLMTASVHAFIALLAVSRRATYAQTERDQLAHALRQVAVFYADMLSACGCAVGQASDDQSVLEADEKASRCALQLSSLLSTVKKLKVSRAGPHTVLF